MRIKQFCESGLSSVVGTNKHNKIRTMDYSKLMSTSSNLFEKKNLENCFQFSIMKFLLRQFISSFMLKFSLFYFQVSLCGMTNTML